MGCFRACFSLSKSRKLGKSAIKTSLRDHIKKPTEAIHPANFETKSRDELEKYSNLGIPFKFTVNSSCPAPQIELENARELLATTAKKKVTFDLVIKDNAIDLIQKSSATLHPADKLENDTDHSIPFKQNAQKQEHSSGIKKVAHEAESTVEIDDSLVAENNGKKRCCEKAKKGEEIEDLLESKALTYPGNHRYGNYTTNDEESEDGDFDENNFGEEDNQNNNQNKTVIPSESSGSLFSLSIDFIAPGCIHENAEKEVNSAVKMSDFPDLEAMEMDRGYQNDRASSHGCVHENAEKEVNNAVKMSDFPDLEAMEMDRGYQNDRASSHCVNAVSNPVENLTQRKAAKERTARPFGHHQEKENISSDIEYKSTERNSKHRIAVDTSLSSWLVESENTPKSKCSDNSIGNYSSLEKGSSARSYEDRPILGALTMEDLKQFSASPSPIRSRSRSPVETPIIGSVGSYWTRTQEDLKQLSASSSPIQSRSRSPVETPIIGTVGSYWSHTDLISNSSNRGLTHSAREENTRRQKTTFAARLEKALEGNLAEV